jgi:anaerobic magnesium-protoporphyrin IX monomethyl ester cyclase
MNDKKVVLVIPQDTIGAEPLIYPPLGILYIAAVLKRDGFNVILYDMREQYNTEENIPECDIYGFTAVTAQINQAKSLSQKLRSNGKYTIIGGPCASYSSEEIKDYFDAIMIGEGEDIITEVLNNKTTGIIDSNKYPRKDINLIPYPERHLLPDHRIVTHELWEGYNFGTGPKATTLITSRGCPWKCAFCANIPQKIRFRSVENVITEIEEITTQHNCKNFKFIDDNFLTSKKRLGNLMKEFNKLQISFRCNGRSDLITSEADFLQLGGCKEIGLGIETTDDNILKLINKKETVDQHRQAIKIIKNHNIKVKAFFLLGLPGETWNTIQQIKDFVLETKPNKWILSLFTPYPGCDMWTKPQEYGFKIINKNWDKYYQTHPTQSTIETETTKKEEFEAHYNDIVSFFNKQKDNI